MLNLWDIVVVAFVGWRVWRGWHLGLVNEVFGLLAIMAGTVAAVWFSHSIETLLGPFLGHGQVTHLAALVAAFAVIALFIIGIGAVVTKVVHALFFGILNRSLGVAFGVISGFSMAIVVSFFLMAWDVGSLSHKVGASITGRVAAGMAGAIRSALPDKVVQQVSKNI